MQVRGQYLKWMLHEESCPSMDLNHSVVVEVCLLSFEVLRAFLPFLPPDASNLFAGDRVSVEIVLQHTVALAELEDR